MIGIISYGLGNVTAFQSCFRELDIQAEPVKDPNKLKNYTHIILPGVGAFDEAVTKLHRTGFYNEIINSSQNGIFLLGICVGMQVLARSSDEGELNGLNLIPGNVKSLKNNSKNNNLLMPHMGWNQIKFLDKKSIFKGFEDNDEFYFLHSYYYECDSNDNEISSTNYGSDFCTAVNKENIYGVQFHPEKSHLNGKKLLKNFAELR